MTGDAALRAALRGAAIAIAVVALWDPSVATQRRTKPSALVVAADSAHDGDAAARVRAALGNRLAISRALIAGTDAAIVVGDRIPLNDGDLPTPTFVVSPAVSAPDAELLRFDAPRGAAALGRIEAPAVVRARNARGKTIEVVLRLGDAAVDRVALTPSRDDDTVSVPLAFVAAAPGVVELSATASIAGRTTDRAVAATEVRARRWSVLFFDGRPSWTSTFIRRAIEQDPRIDVTSRTVTSRNITTEAGTPPPRLDDLSTIAAFDAIVVGAPDALSQTDVAGLENYLRRRGGSAILLFDQAAPSPIDRLAAVAKWTTATLDKPTAIAIARDSAALRVAELAVPGALPIGASVVAGSASRPVVWREPVGSGHLIVSGALDAWRFRDTTESAFDRFWRTTIASAASESPAPISVDLAQRIVQPGAVVPAEIIVRDAALRAPTSSGVATLALDSARVIPVYSSANGVERAEFRAPRHNGVHRVAATIDGKRAEAAFIVAPMPAMTRVASPPLLGAWAAARGGAVVSEAGLDSLATAIETAVGRMPHVVVWHPMRSPWWLLPFVLALSTEWWMRRRRGLR